MSVPRPASRSLGCCRSESAVRYSTVGLLAGQRYYTGSKDRIFQVCHIERRYLEFSETADTVQIHDTQRVKKDFWLAQKNALIRLRRRSTLLRITEYT